MGSQDLIIVRDTKTGEPIGSYERSTVEQSARQGDVRFQEALQRDERLSGPPVPFEQRTGALSPQFSGGQQMTKEQVEHLANVSKAEEPFTINTGATQATEKIEQNLQNIQTLTRDIPRDKFEFPVAVSKATGREQIFIPSEYRQEFERRGISNIPLGGKQFQVRFATPEFFQNIEQQAVSGVGLLTIEDRTPTRDLPEVKQIDYVKQLQENVSIPLVTTPTTTERTQPLTKQEQIAYKILEGEEKIENLPIIKNLHDIQEEKLTVKEGDNPFIKFGKGFARTFVGFPESVGKTGVRASAFVESLTTSETREKSLEILPQAFSSFATSQKEFGQKIISGEPETLGETTAIIFPFIKSPIKLKTAEIPTATGTTRYVGVVLEKGGGPSQPLVGVTGTKPTLGTPNVENLVLAGKEGITPLQSAVEVKYVREAFPKEQVDLLNTVLESQKILEHQKNVGVQPIDFSNIKYIPKEVAPKLESYIKEQAKSGDLELVYGSSVQKAQGALSREVHDLDISIKNSPQKAQDIYSIFKKELGEKNVKLEETLVSVKGKDGTFHHAVDIHEAGTVKIEGSPPSSGYIGYGFKPQSSIKIEGIPAMRLSEQFVRKGSSISTPKSKTVIGPESHRIKDVPDFLEAGQKLIESGRESFPDIINPLKQVKLTQAEESLAKVKEHFDIDPFIKEKGKTLLVGVDTKTGETQIIGEPSQKGVPIETTPYIQYIAESRIPKETVSPYKKFIKETKGVPQVTTPYQSYIGKKKFDEMLGKEERKQAPSKDIKSEETPYGRYISQAKLKEIGLESPSVRLPSQARKHYESPFIETPSKSPSPKPSKKSETPSPSPHARFTDLDKPSLPPYKPPKSPSGSYYKPPNLPSTPFILPPSVTTYPTSKSPSPYPTSKPPYSPYYKKLEEVFKIKEKKQTKPDKASLELGKFGDIPKTLYPDLATVIASQILKGGATAPKFKPSEERYFGVQLRTRTKEFEPILSRKRRR